MTIFFISRFTLYYNQDYDSELNLRFVRIYFYATTFDRITKDRAAKFVDMISAIGGTLGLFTGFSIMSAFELVYFGIKIIVEAFKAKKAKIISKVAETKS